MVEVWLWPLFGLAIGALLLVDLLVAGRSDGPPSLRSAAAWSVLWTALALAFAPLLTLWSGGEAGGEYLVGYVVERSLSLDNLFVFTLVFASLAVPAQAQRRALVIGIAIAIVLRAIFILAGGGLLAAFHWTVYAFGGLLILTAFRMAKDHHVEVNPRRNLLLRLARRLVPMSDEYRGDRVVVRDGARLVATPLLTALLMIAGFDVVFAVDSIPAIFAITRDTFIVFAANAFSLLGMTSLYFLLAGMVRRFRYLNLGLAAILVFVGAKMLASDVTHVSPAVSLAVICGALAGAILASLLAERRQAGAPASRPQAPESPPTRAKRSSSALRSPPGERRVHPDSPLTRRAPK